jgi:hypothetical protein
MSAVADGRSARLGGGVFCRLRLNFFGNSLARAGVVWALFVGLVRFTRVTIGGIHA